LVYRIYQEGFLEYIESPPREGHVFIPGLAPAILANERVHIENIFDGFHVDKIIPLD